MDFNILQKPHRCRTKDKFWFQEIKSVILAITKDGYTLAEIEKESKDRNFFNATSDSRAKEIMNAVNRRMEGVTDSYMQFFCNQMTDDQKLLAFILIMLEDRTIYDFMNEFYKEKLIARDTTILDSEILGYIHSLQGVEEKAASWTDASMKKLRSNIKEMLRDCGLVKYEQNKLIVLRPIITNEMRDFLNNENLSPIVKIFAGER